jgi:GNAT superfamily N-acetyltransferase
MTGTLTDLSDGSLARAIKANLYAFFRNLGNSDQVEYYKDPGLIRWRTQIPHPWFNGVLSTQTPGDSSSTLIRENLDYFRIHQVESITWWVDVGVQLNTWGKPLLLQGFVHNTAIPGMAVELATLPPEIHLPVGFEIHLVDRESMLETWSKVFIRGYELPDEWQPAFYRLIASIGIDLPYRYYLGIWNGVPVATSTSLLAEGVVGIFNVATLPTARGQGFGAQITLAPLLEGRQTGYSAGVLQSSEMGYPVYQRLRFRRLCSMEHYYWIDPRRNR